MGTILKFFIIFSSFLSTTIAFFMLWFFFNSYSIENIIYVHKNNLVFYFFISTVISLFFIFFISKILISHCLKKYNQSLNILKDIIQNEENMEKIPLEDFEFVIRELKQFVKENIETTEQAKHRHKNISEIMDSMEDGIIFLNNTYHIILANKSALKIFSIHKYRKNYTFIQLYRNQVVTKALRTLNSSEPKILDIIINKRTIRLTLNIFKNGYTIFTKDVTEKLNLEKFQNETITNVSHFLKTPITSIVGFSELVSKKMITDLDKIVEYNQKIYDSGQVLIKLIEDTIILESIEKEDKNDVEEIEITSIVGEVISIYHNQIEEKNIVINVKGNATIKINHMHILYLISNLIENAIKYNIVDGKINIEINKIDNIILTIEDTGIGIEKENLDIIFNRYYRVKNEIKGNGLGLSIVDSIAKIYNIDINIESELYIGSKFIVTFLN